MEAILCITGCLAASFASTCQIPVAPHLCAPNCDTAVSRHCQMPPGVNLFLHLRSTGLKCQSHSRWKHLFPKQIPRACLAQRLLQDRLLFLGHGSFGLLSFPHLYILRCPPLHLFQGLHLEGAASCISRTDSKRGTKCSLHSAQTARRMRHRR